MEVAVRLIRRFFKWEYSWLCLIVVATLILHFIIIAVPAQPLFDEAHYIPDARTIINSHYTNRGEHPPLAKLLMVTGFLVFGDNPYGWRIPSIVAGTLGIIFFYLMCRRFNLSRRTAVLGTFILGTENLYFVHAGIAMLDIFIVAFMLMAFWLYARRSYALSGVGVALATLCKFTGVFAIFAIILHWLICRRDRPIVFIASLLISALSFFLLLAAFDAAIYLRMIDFLTQLKNGLEATGGLTFVTAKHVSMSRPWEWVFNLEIMPYWFGPHFIGLVSFSVWAMIVPTIGYMVYKAIKRNSAALFVICWFIATYVVWIPLNIITDRITFIFYFLPTVPAICFGLGILLNDLINFWQKKRPVRVKNVLPLENITPSAPEQISGPEAPRENMPPESGTPENPPGENLAPPPVIPPPAAALPEPPTKWWHKGKLQWAAIGFVVLFFLVQIATFVIVAPPLNNWPIETWFQ